MITKEFFKKMFNLTDMQTNTMFNYFKSSKEGQLKVLVQEPQTIEQRIDFFKMLGMTAEGIFKNPFVLEFDVTETTKENPDGLQASIMELKNTIGLSNKTIANNPWILNLDCTHTPQNNPFGVLAMASFYSKNLKFSSKEFDSYPMLFRLDTFSSPEENPEGAQARVKTLNFLPLEKDYALKHPIILFASPSKLKRGFCLGAYLYGNLNFTKGTAWATINENKVYARFRYAQEILTNNVRDDYPCKKPAYSLIYGDKAGFEKQFKVSEQEIMEQYPLTSNRLGRIVNNFEDIMANLEENTPENEEEKQIVS